ncbi:MAG: CpsB/CapC family capsule biosynthesis tyrosine phosphatase [Huintestinicola sp.]
MPNITEPDLRVYFPSTDFHAHILPAFDDGPKTCREAAQMLIKMYHDGVDRVVSTSHFYRHNETISEFIARRDKAYAELTEYLHENDIQDVPKIIMGAEVYFSPALKNEFDLEKLCIENTHYMLVELPYSGLSPNVLREYESFLSSGRVKTVLAHVERYAEFGGKDAIMKFIETDSLAQINCDSLLGVFGSGFPFHLIKEGFVQAIGTDGHNMSSRTPKFGEAKKKLTAKMGSGVYNSVMKAADGILSDLPIYDILNT